LQGWIDTCIHLLKKVDYIVLSTGADAQEVELAQDIQRACGEGVILTEGKLSWKQNADLLYRSKLFVGVDTAMMHLAAACQCKIVAIWGPTWEGIWRPWQADCRLIMPQGFAPLPYNLPLEERAIIEQRLTAKVCTEDVIRACDEMLEGT
jgi:heptosyltransferase-3